MPSSKTILGILFVLSMSFAPALRAQGQAPPDQQGQGQPQSPTAPVEDPADEPYEEEAAGEATVTFGVKAGLNVGWLRNDDSTMDERLGPMVGLFGAAPIVGPLGIQVEAFYASKGFKSGTRSIALDYVEVPVLAAMRLPRLGPVRPLLLTGPSAALRVRTRYGAAKTSTQEAFRDDVRRWDFGWVVGAALELALPRGGLLIEGRYSVGLGQVFVEGSSYSKGGDRNRAYVGLLGYRF